MEISLLGQSGIRLKGKRGVLSVDALDKITQAVFFLQATNSLSIPEHIVAIHGPGEHEIGGVKVSGFRSGEGIVYSLTLDSIAIAVGTIQTVSALQNKLKEHNIIVVRCNKEENASFLTNLASNVVVFYGENAATISQAFPKEKTQETSKYMTTLEKLPVELETVVLSS